MIATNLMT